MPLPTDEEMTQAVKDKIKLNLELPKQEKNVKPELYGASGDCTLSPDFSKRKKTIRQIYDEQLMLANCLGQSHKKFNDTGFGNDFQVELTITRVS